MADVCTQSLQMKCKEAYLGQNGTSSPLTRAFCTDHCFIPTITDHHLRIWGVKALVAVLHHPQLMGTVNADDVSLVKVTIGTLYRMKVVCATWPERNTGR